MPYVQGFVAAVPRERRDAFVAHAEAAWRLFHDHGATSVRECWEEDVPEGRSTSFSKAVRREPGEAVVFSWLEWPDKATCDACFAAMETDARFAEIAEMPFDGSRMIYGGFTPVVSHG